ncbi:lysophospholipase L1-like esterase [Saccharopolyspora erythraea NRRL 2338]|uniref:Lipolytic enzyme, G-D-S-L family n=2 Tax=Saccharopolyspora erythraea TaxID=1836 RepID=A4F714_SACEN|nr:SGNH/GDSL hydrolase family protein [Saccharopolyspora erythraea]EQD83116.1 SGNH hydrolase [Saccharopolyspora erythraea D]PFG93637.1 lysophospholipase L1-like esterase [Saccharopolyspora erythraea NRRL 2338]QRK90492.1 SGNH/GDSL hydrolase family protein [Saccharopolyspora erythraea]CAL99838.1 lipolytic enzyme, G-D-S-L family [Saccharopolyspora erythraea NRRL 2338]
MGGWERSSAVDATSLGSYVALGDSFTEGMEDARPDGGYRGWADRLAERLAARNPGLRYANLAVRGKLIRQIVDDQVPEAIGLRPGLVSFTAGGNDIIRPGSDPDAVAELFESAVAELSATGARLLIGTGFDTRDTPVLRHVRGKVGTYNSHLRAIADKYDCGVIDLWSMQVLQDPRAWSADRLHLSPEGHRRVALRAAEALGLPVTEDWREPWPPRPEQSWRTQRIQDIQWAREYLAPWIGRRLRGQSSGDGRAPKRPKLERLCGAQSSASASPSEAERC